MRKYKARFYQQMVNILFLIVIIAFLAPVCASAESVKQDVPGTVYVLNDGDDYQLDSAVSSFPTDKENTYGRFSLFGDIAAVSVNENVISYGIVSENVELHYDYDDVVLNAGEEDWHLVDEKSKTIDGTKRDSKILKGAILVQVSRDHKNWTDVQYITNAFHETPINSNAIYTTKDVELLSGCYYRVTVVYQVRRLIEEKNVLFVPIKEYEEKEIAEVYEFHAYNVDTYENLTDNDEKYSMGEKKRVEKFEGYVGEQEALKEKDPHYGWDLGKFFVTGYTQKSEDLNGNAVFLKNVGDKVALWFNLEQNIDALNNNENLSITADEEGYDQYFETGRMNFGKGVLIIRHTDHNNVKGEPQVYTNYLEANATVGVDTKVQLFEEGDYEVSLNYQVTNDKLIDKVAHYKIFFKFSVRNSNCMVFPFDIADGAELTNSSMTENGFRLDLAKSRYLKIYISREILTESADGLVADTRFNGAAKDGAEYTEEGIYTITVNNVYTGQCTTKRIYVGSNKVMRAHMTTGLSIPEINNLVADGAVIGDDGAVTLGAGSSEIPQKPNGSLILEEPEKQAQGWLLTTIIIVAVVFLSAAVVLAFVIRKKKGNSPEKNL